MSFLRFSRVNKLLRNPRTSFSVSSTHICIFIMSSTHICIFIMSSTHICIFIIPLVSSFRSNLAIIPQDPFLFFGSVRENLDPTGRFSDFELWAVLDKCHLKSAVESLGGLESEAGEKGRRFSAGQRQLLCLARAMLTGAKVSFNSRKIQARNRPGISRRPRRPLPSLPLYWPWCPLQMSQYHGQFCRALFPHGRCALFGRSSGVSCQRQSVCAMRLSTFRSHSTQNKNQVKVYVRVKDQRKTKSL